MKSCLKTSSVFPDVENFQFSLLFLCFLFFQPQLTVAQNFQKNVFVHNWFDNITGTESTDLHYGKVYLEKHRLKSTKTKFFVSPEFRRGVVYFNGQPYYNLNLKYDVYDDNLILQVKNELGGTPLLLRKAYIDSFAIESHKFKNIASGDTEETSSSGFHEIYRTTPFFSILKKHRKRLLSNLGNAEAYHEFESVTPLFVLEYKNDLFTLKKIKDVKSIFPEYSDELEVIGNLKSIDDASIDVLIDFLIERLHNTNEDE